MLILHRVAKAFGARRVLNGLDLEVRAGEAVALLGANGSGKTTTLRCIAGLARPDAGHIGIAGVDAIRDPVGARRHLSYLPQRPAFPPTLTVRETLAVVARLRRLPHADVDGELCACGLDAIAGRSVCALSGGERQRLAIAAAFLPRAGVYLFDEPTASLDPSATRILYQRARELSRSGGTLLFTTHVPADVRRLATRVVLLRDGRIESEGAGMFELKRYERMLERSMWGEDDDDAMRRDADAGDAADGVRESIARA